MVMVPFRLAGGLATVYSSTVQVQLAAGLTARGLIADAGRPIPGIPTDPDPAQPVTPVLNRACLTV